jgi:formate/nitrite transporter FocA (FNT family)
MFQPHMTEPLLRLARETTDGGFLAVAWKAVFAGWLVALMAWLVASTHSTFAQVALIWLTTAPIAAFGFRHSIAGAVEAFYRALAGDASWGRMLGEFLVPALIGNIVGGVLLVALLNHGQVAVGREEHEKPV